MEAVPPTQCHNLRLTVRIFLQNIKKIACTYTHTTLNYQTVSSKFSTSEKLSIYYICIPFSIPFFRGSLLQESNLDLLLCRQILYCVRHLGSPYTCLIVSDGWFRICKWRNMGSQAAWVVRNLWICLLPCPNKQRPGRYGNCSYLMSTCQMPNSQWTTSFRLMVIPGGGCHYYSLRLVKAVVFPVVFPVVM